MLNVSRAIALQRDRFAFFSSCCVLAAFVFLFMAALFPFILPAKTQLQNGLTLFNAASSETTLWIMLMIAIIGMPCVLAYTGIIYWTFRGKVKLDDHSY